jgi:hypothetical protein
MTGVMNVLRRPRITSPNRGFEPGQEDENWSLAELRTDAVDAGRKS